MYITINLVSRDVGTKNIGDDTPMNRERAKIARLNESGRASNLHSRGHNLSKLRKKK